MSASCVISRLGLAVVLVACSDSTSPGRATGTVDLSYTGGDGRGELTVTGPVPEPDETLPTYIMVLPVTSGPSSNAPLTLVIGFTDNGALPDAYASIVFPAGVLTTTSIVSTTCNGSCAEVEVGFGGTPFQQGAPDFDCRLSSGSISVTALQPTLQGSFSGTGQCTDRSGATTAFSITTGTFSVPVQTSP